MLLYLLLSIPILLSLGVVALAMTGLRTGGTMPTVALVLGVAALAISLYGALIARQAVSDVQRALGGLGRLGEGLDRGLPEQLRERLRPGSER